MFETQIDNGIRFLDEKHGIGWEHKIDVETLDISSPCGCVCGQLFEHKRAHMTGYSYFTLELNPGSYGEEYGFSIPVLEESTTDEEWANFAQLTDEWKGAIVSLCAANRIPVAVG